MQRQGSGRLRPLPAASCRRQAPRRRRGLPGRLRASPQSPFGIKAAEAKAAIDEKIANTIPPTVTTDWCSRLAARLEPRLRAQAAAKYLTHDPGFLTQSVHGNVENVVVDCKEDVGKPTAGLWTCRWNETFNTAADCDKLGEVARGH